MRIDRGINGPSKSPRQNIIRRALISSFERATISFLFLSVCFRASLYGPSRPVSYMPRSPLSPDQVISNPCLPPHPDFLDTSTPNEKRRWHYSNPSSPLPIPRPIPPRLDRKHRYSFRLSIQELQVTSHLRNFFVQPKRIVLIVLPILLTTAISVIIVHARHYIKDNMYKSSFSNSTGLLQFCSLYENNYYVNLVTLPIAVVIILIITFNQTRSKHCRSNREKKAGKFAIYAQTQVLY